MNSSDLARGADRPRIAWKVAYTWDMTDDEKMGLVWKLRSTPPRAAMQPEQ